MFVYVCSSSSSSSASSFSYLYGLCASHFNQCEKFFGKFHQLMMKKSGRKKSYAKLNSVQKFLRFVFVGRNFCITLGGSCAGEYPVNKVFIETEIKLTTMDKDLQKLNRNCRVFLLVILLPLLTGAGLNWICLYISSWGERETWP